MQLAGEHWDAVHPGVIPKPVAGHADLAAAGFLNGALIEVGSLLVRGPGASGIGVEVGEQEAEAADHWGLVSQLAMLRHAGVAGAPALGRTGRLGEAKPAGAQPASLGDASAALSKQLVCPSCHRLDDHAAICRPPTGG